MYSDHPAFGPYKEKQLAYFRHLKEQIKARQTKVASVRLRNEWLQRQKASNYHNEYDRIAGELSRTVLPHGVTREKLVNRQKELDKLIKESLS